jgi:metallopeptidase MepB
MSAKASTKAKGDASKHETIAPPVPPPLFDATSTTILSTARELIDASERLHDMIVQNVDPAVATFENTVLPIIHEENRLLCERQLVEFLASVSPSEDIRQAARTAKRLFAEFDARRMTRQDLYDLLSVVKGRAEITDVESRHFLDKLLSESSRHGLAVTSGRRTRLQEIDRELSMIETEYLHNLQPPEDLGICVEREKLEGVPRRFRIPPGDGECGNGGNVRLKVAGRMHLLDLLSHVKSHKAREKIYREYVSHHQSNATLFERAIILRHEKAQILGYRTYAEWSMTTKMEKDPRRIAEFLQDLLTTVRPARDSIVERWRLMKKEDLEELNEPDDGCFYAWDRPYYTKRMVEHRFALDLDTVKDYFPLEHTASCMLGIFGHLFGLHFVNTDELTDHASLVDGKRSPQVWHEDVLLFAVWDSPGSDRKDTDFLGYLYMDLYCRPGKRPGFADLPIRPVCDPCDIKRMKCKELTTIRDSFAKMECALSLQRDWYATLTSLRRENHAPYSMRM